MVTYNLLTITLSVSEEKASKQASRGDGQGSWKLESGCPSCPIEEDTGAVALNCDRYYYLPFQGCCEIQIHEIHFSGGNVSTKILYS